MAYRSVALPLPDYRDVELHQTNIKNIYQRWREAEVWGVHVSKKSMIPLNEYT